MKYLIFASIVILSFIFGWNVQKYFYVDQCLDSGGQIVELNKVQTCQWG